MYTPDLYANSYTNLYKYQYDIPQYVNNVYVYIYIIFYLNIIIIITYNNTTLMFL